MFFDYDGPGPIPWQSPSTRELLAATAVVSKQVAAVVPVQCPLLLECAKHGQGNTSKNEPKLTVAIYNKKLLF
jgi:hypothetical protein